MHNMSQIDRNQISRYDLQETRTRMLEPTERGSKILAVMTLIFTGVLAALTFAAAQVFDGLHHLIVIGDVVLVIAAIAAWISSTRPPAPIETFESFVPAGIRQTSRS
jgi:hypothetical protein